jgi:DNA-binding transcriptional LysR family regulator
MPRKTPAFPRRFEGSLSWSQLEYFRTVAQLQHVTRAANRLGVSQPALSRALAKLESALGVPLYERVGRSIRLTRYGELFRHHVDRALTEIETGRRQINDLANPDRGTVVIGFLRSLGARYVPQLIRQFNAIKPGVTLSVGQGTSEFLEEELLAGNLDLAFTSSLGDPSGFERTPVSYQELKLAVIDSHPLARMEAVKLGDLAEESFVTVKSGHAFRRVTDDLCSRAGFVPRIACVGEGTSGLLGFVAAGFGVSIVPPDFGSFTGVTLIRIAEPSARRDISITWVKGRHLPAGARAFRDFVTSHANIADPA